MTLIDILKSNYLEEIKIGLYKSKSFFEFRDFIRDLLDNHKLECRDLNSLVSDLLIILTPK